MKDTDWEILCELYKNPNMTKVANCLFMTQPSLTKRLQRMEEEFQIQIVNRSSKGLSFTEEGEYLAKQAQEYMHFLNVTKMTIELMKEKGSKSIVIGSSYTYSRADLPDILVDYREKEPKLSFEIVTEQSNILFRKMLEGSLDVAFIRGDYEGPVHRMLVAKNEAYLCTKNPVHMEDLPHMQFISYKTNDVTKQLIEEWWRNRFGEDMSPGMNVGYIDVAWQLVEKGVGYTICYLPTDFENKYNLCLTPITNQDGSYVIRNTWFVYPKNKRLNKELEDFIKYIEKDVAID